MKKITATLFGAAVLGLSATVTMASDEVRKAEVLAPWHGEGQIYVSEPGKAKFMGVLKGIMYVQTGHKETIDTLPFVCPSIQEMNIKNQTLITTGDCQIGAGDDIIFASYECSGPIGGCEGTFKLKGGTGNFEKISGGSKLSARTKMSETLIDATNGIAVKEATGIMILPELTYKIPQ
jgi:hypothetical protein